MPTTTKRYSRGNNDPAENQYETAVIDITLDVDPSGCSAPAGGCLGRLFRFLPQERAREVQVGEGVKLAGGTCTGDVVVKLKYRATASTADPQFTTLGPNFALNDGGQGGNSAQMAHAAAPPVGPRGDTLTAEINLASIPCAGSKLRGTVGVEGRPPGGAFTGFVTQRIAYDIEITPCGVIAKSEISAKELNPGVVIGRLPTPLRDITPPAGGGAPLEAPYPAHPGVPRTP